MNVLVVSCSLNPQSRSAVMARHAVAALEAMGVAVNRADLREMDLPLCGGDGAYAAEDTVAMKQAVERADAVILAVPIYNYDVNAAAKNLVELTGKAWAGKVVAFLCAAGGRGSYMSVMSLANSLMLDFRCVIVPRFVYTTGVDFDGDGSAKPGLIERVEELSLELHRVAAALTTDVPAARPSRPLGE